MPIDEPPLFFLGLAAGIALLPTTAYRHVSPNWLRWLLIATGLGMTARYAVTGQLAGAGTAVPPHLLRADWLVVFLDVTLPGVFAMDQLVRHPAITPRRLLTWYAPCLALAAAAAVLGPPFPSLVSAAFAVGFAAIACILMRKLPGWTVRLALLALAAGMALVAIGGLAAEIVVLLALWHAYETGARLQREAVSL